MPLGGIRTHDPSKRWAADLRLRPRDHWDPQLCPLILYIPLNVRFNYQVFEVTKYGYYYLFSWCSAEKLSKIRRSLSRSTCKPQFHCPPSHTWLLHKVTLLSVLILEALTLFKARDYSRSCAQTQAQLTLLRKGHRAASTKLHDTVVPPGLCCQEVAVSALWNNLSPTPACKVTHNIQVQGMELVFRRRMSPCTHLHLSFTFVLLLGIGKLYVYNYLYFKCAHPHRYCVNQVLSHNNYAIVILDLQCVHNFEIHCFQNINFIKVLTSNLYKARQHKHKIYVHRDTMIWI
jgi:hypothetical protein